MFLLVFLLNIDQKSPFEPDEKEVDQTQEKEV